MTCDSVKVLGHTWNVESDTISLKKTTYILKSQGLTKRNVLKELASVFDPLGLVCPEREAFHSIAMEQTP